MQIAHRKIGPSEPPLVIAEIGINHGGDLDVARHMVTLAAKAGAEGEVVRRRPSREFTREPARRENPRYQRHDDEPGVVGEHADPEDREERYAAVSQRWEEAAGSSESGHGATISGGQDEGQGGWWSSGH